MAASKQNDHKTLHKMRRMLRAENIWFQNVCLHRHTIGNMTDKPFTWRFCLYLWKHRYSTLSAMHHRRNQYNIQRTNRYWKLFISAATICCRDNSDRSKYHWPMQTRTMSPVFSQCNITRCCKIPYSVHGWPLFFRLLAAITHTDGKTFV